jgi:hypothetical protein
MGDTRRTKHQEFSVTWNITIQNEFHAADTKMQNPLFQFAIDAMLTSATTWKQKQTNTPPTTHSHQFQLSHDSSRQQYGYVHHSIELTIFSSEYTLFKNCNFNLVYRYSLSVKFNSLYYSVTVTRCCSYSLFVLLKMGDSETRNM